MCDLMAHTTHRGG